MRYCPYCGKELVGDFKFCPYCGKNLKEEPCKADGEPKPEEKYHFENPQEFIIYSAAFTPDHSVIWVSPDAYVEKIKKAYELFEEQRFKDAISVLNEALELNPIGVSARFEMAEAYMQLRDFASAEKTLLSMKDYLYDNTLIARFYRRYGFMQIEKGLFDEAAACYVYSLEFENNPSVMQELMYISSQTGKKVTKEDPRKTLEKSNIPVIAKED